MFLKNLSPFYTESQQLHDDFRDSRSQSKTNNFSEMTMNHMCVLMQPVYLHKHASYGLFLLDLFFHTQRQSTILHQKYNFSKAWTKRNRL